MNDQSAACTNCSEILESPDTVHIVRECPTCGRKLRIANPGKHGIGIKVEKGDQLVIPPGALKISLDPTKSTGTFSNAGLAWAASMFIVDDLVQKKTTYPQEVQRYAEYCEQIVRRTPLLEGIELDSEVDQPRVIDVLTKNTHDIAYWAWLVVIFSQAARDAVAESNAELAAWNTALAERFRMMVVFKESLQRPVEMAHAARSVLDAMSLWNTQRTNSDEEFWQTALKERAFLLSQIFSVPAMIIEDKAYVGGIDVSGSGGKFVDFLMGNSSTETTLIVEIKVPTAKLLGRKYRGTHAPSPELVGAIVQALDYRSTFHRDGSRLLGSTERPWTAENARTVLLIGDSERELTSADKRRAFNLFRSALKDVEVVTFDELFKKADILIGLFGLRRENP